MPPFDSHMLEWILQHKGCMYEIQYLFTAADCSVLGLRPGLQQWRTCGQR